MREATMLADTTVREASGILPDGLTEIAFRDILKTRLKNVQINGFETTAGSKTGNNYLSEISKITVHYTNGSEEGSQSFIIKDPRKATSDFVNSIGGIKKELSWYENVLPEVEKLEVVFGAKCYLKHNDWLLLEDLNAEGYKVLDRKAMLDLEHCVIAVKALAKFHAVTHYLYEENKLPQSIMQDNQFSEGCDHVLYEDFIYYKKLVENLLDAGGTEFYEAIKSLEPVIWSKMRQCIKDNQQFLCLVHGDFWTTNILFKYDNKFKVSDAKLIDFQLTRLGIPAYDLHSFVCSTMRPHVRDNHLEEIYKEYLEALNSTLKSIGSKSSLSQDQFNKMMKGSSFMGLFIALAFLPIPLCETYIQFEPPQHLSPEDKMSYHGFLAVFPEKTYRTQLLSMLDFYRRTNVL